MRDGGNGQLLESNNSIVGPALGTVLEAQFYLSGFGEALVEGITKTRYVKTSPWVVAFITLICQNTQNLEFIKTRLE